MHLRRWLRLLPIIGLLSLGTLHADLSGPTTASAQGTVYSVWLLESSTFKDVPAGGFMPDRAYVPGSTNAMNNKVFFDLPVNFGVIKGGNDVVLYDTGW